MQWKLWPIKSKVNWNLFFSSKVYFQQVWFSFEGIELTITLASSFDQTQRLESRELASRLNPSEEYNELVSELDSNNETKNLDYTSEKPQRVPTQQPPPRFKIPDNNEFDSELDTYLNENNSLDYSKKRPQIPLPQKGRPKFKPPEHIVFELDSDSDYKINSSSDYSHGSPHSHEYFMNTDVYIALPSYQHYLKPRCAFSRPPYFMVAYPKNKSIRRDYSYS